MNKSRQRRATAFYRDLDRRAALEAAELQRVDARLVVGDIPPLAFAAAARARVPSVALGNFTWDWIYGDYPAFVELAPGGDRYRPPRVCAGDARACGSPPRWVRGDVCGHRGIPFIARRSELGGARRGGGSGSTTIALSCSPPSADMDSTLPIGAIAASSGFTLLTGRAPSGMQPGSRCRRRRGRQQTGLRHRLGLPGE